MCDYVHPKQVTLGVKAEISSDQLVKIIRMYLDTGRPRRKTGFT